MKHLDIKEGEYYQTQKTAKNYFWPVPFAFPMYEPYDTGPMSAPVLSPAGGIVVPRRNPYLSKPANPFLNPYRPQRQCHRCSNPYRTKPANPFLNPYVTQMRQTMGPMYMTLPPSAGGMPPRGPRPGNPMGIPPMSPMRPPSPPGGPMGMPPMGPPPMGPPPMGPRPF